MVVGQEFNPFRKFTGYWTPECLLPYQGISYGAKFLLAVIYRYIGNKEVSWPGQEALALKMNVSVRTIHTYLKELEDDGFVRSKRVGLGQTNIYTALWHPIFEEDSEPNASDPSRKVPSDPSWKTSSDPSYSSEESQKQESDVEQNSDEDSPADFQTLLRHWCRHQHFKKPNRATQFKAEIRWRQVGVPESKIPNLLDGYHDSVWGKQEKYPIMGFLKDPLSWLNPKEPEDEGFDEFRQKYIDTGASCIESDFDKAKPNWRMLSIEDHSKALERISESDPAFIKSPRNYLRDREFDRPPRPEPKSRTQSLIDIA